MFGMLRAVFSALALSTVSRTVNTCFVERHDDTDRDRCGRTLRSHSFVPSKDWDTHRAATLFGHFSDTFCWPVGTRRHRTAEGRWQKRMRVIVAGLSDRVQGLSEWLAHPAVQR